jgi:hypothetical protein
MEYLDNIIARKPIRCAELSITVLVLTEFTADTTQILADDTSRTADET